MTDQQTQSIIDDLLEVAPTLPFTGQSLLDAASALKHLRKALEGLVYFSEDDFPVGKDGKRHWESYCATPRYADAFRAALEALGRDAT